MWRAAETGFNASLVPASCFISHLTAGTPLTYHTLHADEASFPNFHFSGTLYLTGQDSHFQGGSFRFQNRDDGDCAISEVRPRAGRAVLFSSGWENQHQLEEVTAGQRFALSVFFTTAKKKQGKDSGGGGLTPSLQRFISECVHASQARHTALQFIRGCLHQWPAMAAALLHPAQPAERSIPLR